MSRSRRSRVHSTTPCARSEGRGGGGSSRTRGTQPGSFFSMLADASILETLPTSAARRLARRRDILCGRATQSAYVCASKCHQLGGFADAIPCQRGDTELSPDCRPPRRSHPHLPPSLSSNREREGEGERGALPQTQDRCVKGLCVGSLPRAPAMGGRVHCGLEVYTQSALSRDKRTTGPVRQSTNPRPKHTCTTNIDCNRNGHDQLVCETHTLHGYTVVIVDRHTTVSVGGSGP